ncbi:hypothetical protein ALC53_06544, partial [Atta colombica]
SGKIKGLLVIETSSFPKIKKCLIKLKEYGGHEKKFLSAYNAAVIMIREFCKSWKQLVAYYLLNSLLMKQIYKMLYKK